MATGLWCGSRYISASLALILVSTCISSTSASLKHGKAARTNDVEEDMLDLFEDHMSGTWQESLRSAARRTIGNGRKPSRAPIGRGKASTLKLSGKGLGLIKFCESYSELSRRDRHTGEWVIGWGHKDKVSPGQNVSKDEARDLLKQDAKKAEDVVRRLVTVTLHQRQFDALVSYVFSTNEMTFRKSTLLKLVNSEKLDKVPGELLKMHVILPYGRTVHYNGERIGCRQSRVQYWKKSPKLKKCKRGKKKCSSRKKNPRKGRLPKLRPQKVSNSH